MMPCSFGNDDDSWGTNGFLENGAPGSIAVCPMERVRVAVDDPSHTLAVLLEREGIYPSPAIYLTIGQIVTLIQALRMGITDIEMLPPRITPPSSPY